MSGATIKNPCVNLSEYQTTVYGTDVYLGLMHIEKVERKIAIIIPEERRNNGAYTSLENLVKRIPIGIETLQILIFIGAFRFTGKQKHELLIQARFLFGNDQSTFRHPTLLDEPQKEYKLPIITKNPFEDAFDEIEILGFSVSYSPFDLLQTKYRGNVMAKDLVKHHKKQIKMLALPYFQKTCPYEKRSHVFRNMDRCGR